MAGPFPGIDPYLEHQAAWPDFHNRLIAEICNELGARLPESYVARIEERIEIAAADSDQARWFRPDVLVGHFDSLAHRPSVESTSGLTTLEPTLVEILDRDPDELRITWIEVLALPNMELVTAVEVLSPINKSWQGRQSYLDKRDRLHASRVNLVEMDLLLNGPPLPMKAKIGPGLFYSIVARGFRLPMAEVYCWTVRDPLPRIPIPLREADPDIVIDLGTLVSRVYDLGRYALTLRRGEPLPETTPLPPEDRAWVEEMSRLAVQRR
jgi:hypothetical protein